MQRNIFKFVLFFTIVINSFYSCKETPKPVFKLDEIKQAVTNYPIKKRLKKWDSLIKIYHYDDLSKAYLLFERGNDYSSLNENEKANADLEKALTVFKQYRLKEMIAKTYVNLGISYAFIGKKNTAIQYIFKGLDLALQIKNDSIISRAYGELAHIYYLTGNSEKAIEYLKKSGEMYQKMKDTEAISATYNNIAILYQKNNRSKEAIEYIKKSIKIKDSSTTDPLYLIESYNNLGALIYAYTKDKSKSFKYYNKALKIAKRYQIEPISIYENLINYYESTGKIDSAKYYIQKVINTKITGNYQDRINLYDKLLTIYLKQKKDSEALSLLKTRDSLYKIQQKIIDSENQKSIESNMTLLDQQKQLKQARQINNKNRIIFIFIIIIFLLGLLVSYQINRLDKLKYKQEQFILEQQVLRAQMNPHFIFNVLVSIQNSLIENKPVVSATYLSKFAKLIRQNFEYIQKKQISLKEELEMLRNYIDAQKIRYKDKFDYEIIVDDKLSIEQVFIPPMILQPFVENAIEHGFKNISYKGQLSVNIIKRGTDICFEIINNGLDYKPKTDNKEHAMDVFKKRLALFGKEALDSFKIIRLSQGTKFTFCIDLDTTKNIF